MDPSSSSMHLDPSTRWDPSWQPTDCCPLELDLLELDLVLGPAAVVGLAAAEGAAAAAAEAGTVAVEEAGTAAAEEAGIAAAEEAGSAAEEARHLCRQDLHNLHTL